MSESGPDTPEPRPETPATEAGRDDAPAGSETKRPPLPSVAGGTAVAPRRVLRTVGLAALAIVVVIVTGLVANRPRGPAAGSGSDDVGSATTGSAAVRAPEGPSLPGTGVGGVRLGGFVLDGAGLPVAAAEVSAELEKGAADQALAPPPPKALDAGVSVAIDAGAATSAPAIRVSLPTGLDGRFVVEGLEPGRYRVRVTGAGLLPAEVRYVPVPSDATRIVVSRQVGIAGRVTDAAGKPVANVNVGVRGDAIGGQLDRTTDAAGAFSFPELPEGRYQVFAWQGALAARAVRASRLGAGPFPPVELRLEPAAIVVGRVIDRDEGTGMPAAIELRPSGDDQAPRYARSADDGTFRIEGVPNGTWIADAYSPGYLSPGGIEIEAGKGIPEIALTRGATIEGRILDAEGKPIAGAAVRALSSGANPVETSATVDQDKLRRFSGRMAAPTAPPIGGADPTFIPRGELGVTVGPIPPLPPPGVQIATPASVLATSGVMAGEPAPLAIDPARASIWTTGPDGVYRIRGLARGKIRVLAVAAGYAEGRSREVALDAGQTITKVDIVLSPGTILVGKVTDQHGVPVIGAQVTAKPEVGAQLDAFADETGAYRLGPLTGKVELHASAYGHGEATRMLDLAVVKGPAAEEQREDLVLSVADAMIAGTLDDTSGAPAAAATIEIVGGSADGRAGVVGADGTFSIDQLPAGPLKIRIRHPDYPTKEMEVVASDGRQRLRLRLPLGGSIEGAVIEEGNAAPLAGVTVAGSGPAGASAEAVTDKLGRFKLGPLEVGAWKLAVKLAGFLPASRAVDVIAGRTPGQSTVRDIRFDMLRGATVGGTIRDARGQRVSGATVRVVPLKGGGTAVEGTTDSLGEFTVKDAPTGDITVIATKGDLSGSSRLTLRAGDEVRSVAIDMR